MQRIPPSASIASAIDQLYNERSTRGVAEEIHRIYEKLTGPGSSDPKNEGDELKRLYGRLEIRELFKRHYS